ncbi:type 2 isopentenyl-diphosphate Delta-isomerase [Mangrovibacillus cuniculi]|uniref:Isopentenyl-diphosphate delta-isomerase n=1 Tax=Mangrovibacillus cuniculi TaxID=2593652 RepID=A0A7S8CB32_9BACI|nr:type 2 isopentenyl-diphosphate Delta-isomerase [Mangrovibacillus cuniculi]QPC46712.1 type 2 isopentenyl-diphosphate Delta-isomerase [Mangrovibacillus cuniculi]
MSRQQRKLDHITNALQTGQSRSTLLDEVNFVHQSLPNSSVEHVSLHSKMGELSLSSPIFINAMTGGGGKETLEWNQKLSVIARECGLALAVGSQMAALRSREERESYAIVRKENPTGFIMGNLGSEATVDQAKEAVEMLEANALQIHLNVIQELAMPEGDRDFKGALERIQRISDELSVPVIVKETGFGMSQDTIQKLNETSISAIDIGGFGGTNFAKIENLRRPRALDFFHEWGVPTAVSLLEAAAVNPSKTIIASGGIQNALDVLKCLSLGAKFVGIAGVVLKHVKDNGIEDTVSFLHEWHEDLRFMMCAVGAHEIDDLSAAPLIYGENIDRWLRQRGMDSVEMSYRR